MNTVNRFAKRRQKLGESVSRIHSPRLLCSAGTVQTVPLSAVQNLTTKGRQGGSRQPPIVDTRHRLAGEWSHELVLLGQNDKMA